MSTTDVGGLQDPLDEIKRVREAAEADSAQRQAAALRNVFDSASKSNPEEEGRFLDYAKRLGVKREALPNNLDLVKRLVKQKEFNELPDSVKAVMQNVKFVRAVHDDLGNLKQTADTFDWWRRNFEAGETTNELGVLGIKEALGVSTPQDRDRIAEIKKIQEYAAGETGVFDEAAKLLGQMVKPALVSFGMGSAAAGVASIGGPVSSGAAFTYASGAAYFAQSAATESGNEFLTLRDQLIEQGLPPDEAHAQALIGSGVYALGAATLETLGMKVVSAPFKNAGAKLAATLAPSLGIGRGLAKESVSQAFATFAKEYLAGVAGEVLTEGAQEALAIATEHVVSGMNSTANGETYADMFSRVGSVMVQTAKGMSVIAPLGPSIHYAADMTRVKQAKGAAQLFKNLAEAAAQSNVNERNPDTFAAAVNAAVSGSSASHVYIEGPLLAQALEASGQTREQLAQDLPDVAAQLIKAEKTGDDVLIPMGDFAAKIADSKLYPAIKDDIRLSQDGYSNNRAEEWLAEKEANKAETAQVVAEAAAKVVTWDKQAAAVEARMLAEVQKDVRIEKSRAKMLAALHRQFVETQAAREGVEPESYDRMHRLTFEVQRARQAEAEQFDQTTGQRRFDTPEFRAWFRNSAVRDPNSGDPIKVFHGSARPDRIGSRFRKSRATSGPMAFFTSNPEVANGYAMGKVDTSLNVPDSYSGWFSYKPKGMRSTVDIARAWRFLSAEQRAKIAELAPRVGNTDEGTLTLHGPEHKTGLGGYDQHLKEARGNHLAALVEEWLNSGTLFDSEHEFLDVLKLAGMEGAAFEDPHARPSGVVPVYLSIQNPFETSAISPSVVAELKKASRAQRKPAEPGADPWDKRSRDPRAWIEQLEKDVAEGTTMAWTSIPDWVTRTLQRLGYDGIHDTGGKTGGVKHDVWIPFEEHQVKSIFNRGTWSPDSKHLLMQNGSPAGPSNYYSALLRAVKDLPDGVFTVEEWQKQIQLLIDKGVVKEQEYFWTGLKEYLQIAVDTANERRFHLLNGEELVARGSAQDAERWRADLRPDWTVEEVPASYALSKADVQAYLAKHGVTIKAVVDAETLPEPKFRLWSGGTDIGEFDTEDEAYEAMNEAIMQQAMDNLSFNDFSVEKVEPSDIYDVDVIGSPLAGAPKLSFEDYAALVFESYPKFLEHIETSRKGFGYLTNNQRAGSEAQWSDVKAEFQSDDREAVSRVRGMYEGYVERWDEAQDESAKAAAYAENPTTGWKLRFSLAIRDYVSDADQEMVFDTEDEARVAIDEIFNEVRERFEEGLRGDFQIEQINGDDAEAANKFESYIAAHPLTGRKVYDEYHEVALVLPDFPTKFEADNHSFGGEETDRNRVAHLRYTVRHLEAGKAQTFQEWLGTPAAVLLNEKLLAKTNSMHFIEGELKKAWLESERMRTLGTERVMFVEEIQGDWADYGREGGFIPPAKKRVTEADYAKAEILQAKRDAIEMRIRGTDPVEQAKLLIERSTLSIEIANLRGKDPTAAMADVANQKLELARITSEEKRIALVEARGQYSMLSEGASAQQEKAAANKVVEARRAYHEAVANADDLAAAAKAIEDPQALAPFVHTTDAWVGLVAKQILMIAADRNLSRVVLINGVQAGEIYHLGKTVDEITWGTPDLSKLDAGATKLVVAKTREHGAVGFTVNARGLVVDGPSQSIHKPLSKTLGKHVERQILDRWDEESGVLASHEELRIGDVGMRTFYGDPQGYQTDESQRRRLNANKQPMPAIAAKTLADLAKSVGAGDPESVRVGGLSDGEGPTNFSIKLTPEAIKKIGEGFPLFQETTDDARGGFDPLSNKAFLYEKADASTVLHEMSHFWLVTLLRTASLPQASVAARRDAQVVLDWFGVRDIDTWNAMSLEEQRKHHEAWAYNAELYFWDGKAPSSNQEQVSMFRAFGRFVRRAYRAIRDSINLAYRRATGQDLPVLTREVRQVFDRMLASEDAIAAAEAERSAAPLFKAQPEGVSDLDWAAYQAEAQASTDEAVEKLIHDSVQQVKWLGNAQSKLLRRLQRETRALRAQVEDEERRAAEQEPVYVARRALLRAESVEPDGTVVPIQFPKLNAAQTAQMLTAMGEPAGALAGLTNDAGASPDEIASMVGFGSGESLIRALATAPELETAVQDRADARMLAEHSELVDPAKLKDRVERALSNTARTKMVATELRFLGRIAAPVQVMLRAARTQAVETLAETTVRDVRPDKHGHAAVRARRETERAMKKGDTAKTISQKRRELLETQLAREAVKIRDEIDSAKKRFGEFFRADAKLGVTRDVDYIAVGRYLLAAFGLQPNQDVTPASYIEQLQRYNPDLFAKLTPMLARAKEWASAALADGRVVKDYRDLTVDEFRDLTETVDALWNTALREQQFEVSGQKLKLDDIAAQVVAQDAKNPPGKEPPRGGLTSEDERGRTANRLALLAARPEHWAWRKDGAVKAGAFTKFFWRKVRDSVDRYTKTRTTYTKRVAEMVKKLRPSLKQGTIEFRDAAGNVLHVFGRGNGGFGHAELIAALLHTGNEGNLKRLILGRKWGTYDLETSTLDDSAWRQFLASMTRQGYVTEEVMDFVQQIWDLNEELKPMAQRAHRELFGYYFEEVKPVPIKTEWGTYRGGYMPAKLDRTARSAAKVQGFRELEEDFRQSFASTGRGFTKNRSENFAEPLLLDLDLVPSHIDSVLRFAMLQPAIRDVERLAKHPDVAASLGSRQPEVWDRFLLPWLQRVASQSSTKAGMSPDADNFWRYVRSSAGLSMMFANIPNTLQQATGLVTAALRVKPRYIFKGLHRLISERGGLYSDIAGLSPFMADRQHRQIYDSIETIHDLMQNKSQTQKARAWIKKHAYFMQTAMQNAVDAVVWSGAYQQSIDAQGRAATDAAVTAEAVKAADAAVRMTQSSFDPTDVANYEQGSPFYKVFTQFSGFFNSMANLQVDTYVALSRSLGYSKAGAAFMTYVLAFAVPMLLADAVTRSFNGGWGDDDGDGDLADELLLDFFFLGQLKSAAAQIPVAGPNLVSPLLNAFDNQPWNDRMMTSPAVSLLERAGVGTVDAVKRALDAERDVTGRNVRDVITLMGFLFGQPGGTVGKYAGYAFDVAAGNVEPSIRGAISGRATKAEQK